MAKVVELDGRMVLLLIDIGPADKRNLKQITLRCLGWRVNLDSAGAVAGGGFDTAGSGEREREEWGCFAMNVTSINMAGVATFIALGIHPLNWLEAKRAKIAAVVAVVLWFSLPGARVTIILLGTNILNL